MSIQGLGYSAALVLALMFAVAALAKLRDHDGTAAAFFALGVPNPERAARFLPLPELAAVVLLVTVPFAGAIVVLALLALFTTFMIGRLRAGLVAPCACFGATTSQPISWVSVCRNLLMGALAVLALGATRPVMPTIAELAVVVGATLVGTLGLRLLERFRSRART